MLTEISAIGTAAEPTEPRPYAFLAAAMTLAACTLPRMGGHRRGAGGGLASVTYKVTYDLCSAG
jgi:hypothetical protein